MAWTSSCQNKKNIPTLKLFLTSACYISKINHAFRTISSKLNKYLEGHVNEISACHTHTYIVLGTELDMLQIFLGRKHC